MPESASSTKTFKGHLYEGGGNCMVISTENALVIPSEIVDAKLYEFKNKNVKVTISITIEEIS